MNSLNDAKRLLKSVLNNVKWIIWIFLKDLEKDYFLLRKYFQKRQASYETQIDDLSIDVKELKNKLALAEEKASFQEGEHTEKWQDLLQHNESLKNEFNQVLLSYIAIG